LIPIPEYMASHPKKTVIFNLIPSSGDGSIVFLVSLSTFRRGGCLFLQGQLIKETRHRLYCYSSRNVRTTLICIWGSQSYLLQLKPCGPMEVRRFGGTYCACSVLLA
jgi:hypothetical protein